MKGEELKKYGITRCISSPYRRALETAEIIAGEFLKAADVTIIEGLHERIIGNAYEDFWLKQYQDHTYKNEGGESLAEAAVRMNLAIEGILDQMQDGETALVVSHATAICAYLLNFCEIEVVDAEEKIRRITHRGQEVMCRKFRPTAHFRMTYDEGELKNIIFCG